MRLYLTLSNSSQLLSFNYQSYLTGALHKWIGENEVHDKISLYSFSWLQQVDSSRNGLRITDNSYFFISAHEETLIKKIVKGIQEDSRLCSDIYVREVHIAAPPVFSEKERFQLGSPVFIKQWVADNEKHIEYHDPHAGSYLTGMLKKKLSVAGLNTEGVNVYFDERYSSPRTKIISYKQIQNRVNICPVIIEGTPEQLTFAWNVGIGNSTGIGFGSLK